MAAAPAPSTPITPSEAARALGLARRNPISNERKRQIRLEAIDRERLVVITAVWRSYTPVKGDPREYIEREWSRRIPKVYERMLAASISGERIPDSALDLLKAMTVMCRTLAPAANKQIPVDPTILGLPSDADLSHLSDEDLARVLNRPVPGTVDGAGKPRGGNEQKRARTRSGTQHAPEKKKSKSAARGEKKLIEGPKADEVANVR